MRSTGTRRPLRAVAVYGGLPKPVDEKTRAEKIKEQYPTNENHGLYGFFNQERDVVLPGEREALHGRAWEYSELVKKDFSDLHRLYWLGLKEMSIIRTRLLEHERLKVGFGSQEASVRFRVVCVCNCAERKPPPLINFQVRTTNTRIKEVLRDRQYAYEEAQLLLKQKSLKELLPPEGVSI